ncbi:glycosyl hydrolase family 18 protein [Marinicrinis lubricantis]|uniref:Glycosyl hydrolase family 18 protein n=1 Tax=Marinicrinis lubricantis TaxID=2086470 RepID=A0ABW1ISR5_9BACL
MRTRQRWLAGLLGAAALSFILACEMKQSSYTFESSDPSATEASVSLSAWVVDWQLDMGIHDFTALSDRLSGLHLFALYFNDRDALHFTPELKEELPELLERARKSPELDVYLTVVNDIWRADGTAVQKDTDLVTRLVATEQSRRQHVQDLVDAALTYGFDGIEIDYERVGDTDWENMTAFYTELYQALKADGKKLRILFEPSAPLEELSFTLPDGPAYVVMAYNLYGYHSGPGPKADREFLKKLAQRVKDIPGGIHVALSTGGFSWTEEGKVTAVTELEGEKLAKQYQANQQRDPASGAVYFDYTDDAGNRYTVWYADAETFEMWIETLKEEGIDKVALWRLGELGQGTLQYLNEVK